MSIKIQALSSEERDRVHQSTLEILATTGVRVETSLGRKYLADAGAEVDNNTHIVRFPRSLVEAALGHCPKKFTLGARRPGWDMGMNTGECSLVADGEAASVLDWQSEEHRKTTFDDWLKATRLIDQIDEFGVYWSMVEWGDGEIDHSKSIKYWRYLFSNFSKHIQDAIHDRKQATWLLEVLQVIFGDRETIRNKHPYSFLLCPQSPLIIDEQYTDAYLALKGYDIPAAIMPMPLMGGTAPGNMISTTIQANCEVLSMICLIQAAEPGTPILYAPVLAAMNPRTGLYGAGRIENGILSVAAIEMGRYYNLPVVGTGGGTDHFVPGIQAGYERAMTALLPVLSWPDLLVGPGLIGGSTVLSLEQLVIDVEIFRMAKHAASGIYTEEERWLVDVIKEVGPGGNYLGERSTASAIRSGRWYLPQLGHHGGYEAWQKKGEPTILQEAHKQVNSLLAEHNPLPLPPDSDKALKLMEKRVVE